MPINAHKKDLYLEILSKAMRDDVAIYDVALEYGLTQEDMDELIVKLTSPQTQYGSNGFKERVLEKKYGNIIKINSYKGFCESYKNTLETALEQTQAGVIIINAKDSQYNFVNSKAIEITMVSKEEILSLDLKELNLPVKFYRKDRSLYKNGELPIQRAFFRGETVNNEEMIIHHPHEREMHIIANSNPIYNEKGSLEAVVSIFMDVTDKTILQQDLEDFNDVLLEQVRQLREQENMLKDYQYLLEASIDNSQNGMIVVDAVDKAVSFINNVAAKMLEKPKEHYLGMFYLDLLADYRFISTVEGELDAERFPLSRSFSQKEFIQNDEVTIIHRHNSTETIVLISSAPVVDDDGNLIAAVVNLVDITEMKRLQRQLEANNQILSIQNKNLVASEQSITRQYKQLEKAYKELSLLEFTAESASTPIMWLDKESNILKFNNATSKILGYTREELQNLPISKIDNTFEEECWGEFFERLKKYKIIHQKTMLQKKNGSYFLAEITTNYIKYGGEEYAFKFIEDITEREKLKKALEKQKNNLEKMVKKRTEQLNASLEILKTSNLQLEEANRHKSKFLSNMSHELRTPLNAVIGFADLLTQQYYGELNQQQEEYVNLIKDSGQHLMELINDILDISKIDAGTMDLFMETFNANYFMEEVLGILSSQFKAKKISLIKEIEQKDLFIYGDIRKCKQIMLNLLSNALKFTPANGKVTVKVEKNNEEELKISVIDTGIGIEKQYFEKIFEEFYQMDTSRDQALGGTGIGLALTKKLVNLHGGVISLDSIPGKGSSFCFTLKSVPPSQD